jgi:hypothetical protein
MTGERIHRLSRFALIALSLVALLDVLIGFLLMPHPPETDEGTGAHIFQLAIVAFAGMLLLFFATADWRQPWRSARLLALPATFVALAFGVLYYFEHVR